MTNAPSLIFLAGSAREELHFSRVSTNHFILTGISPDALEARTVA
jgi:hypothetical protein